MVGAILVIALSEDSTEVAGEQKVRPSSGGSDMGAYIPELVESQNIPQFPLANIRVIRPYCSIGILNQNTLPFPTSLSTPISPPCISTIRFDILNPNPVPSTFRVSTVST